MVKYVVEVAGKNLRGEDLKRTFTVRAASEAQARERALTVAKRSGPKNPWVKSVSAG